MRINLPNQITIARLIMAVIFFACLAQFNARAETPALWLLDLSAALFLLAAISDIIDGHLARKHNQVTTFGRVFDPFVDKILVIGAYIFLSGDGFLNTEYDKVSDVADWMVVLILGRELLVTSLRGLAESAGQSFAANFYGKAKMALQSITVVWVLVTLAHPEILSFFAMLRPAVVYLMVIVTFLSAIPYLIAAKSHLKQMSASSQ
jgi:CDP-diacylglycerol--glycerol-3-phosphate 3-phosphatidyltransferase